MLNITFFYNNIGQILCNSFTDKQLQEIFNIKDIKYNDITNLKFKEFLSSYSFISPNDTENRKDQIIKIIFSKIIEYKIGILMQYNYNDISYCFYSDPIKDMEEKWDICCIKNNIPIYYDIKCTYNSRTNNFSFPKRTYQNSEFINKSNYYIFLKSDIKTYDDLLNTFVYNENNVLDSYLIKKDDLFNLINNKILTYNDMGLYYILINDKEIQKYNNYFKYIPLKLLI